MRELTVRAPAKINLTLDILRKRPDGYHDLKMVMQSISLGDTLQIRSDTGRKEIIVHTRGANLPDGPENLAWKAAQIFFDKTGIFNNGVAIEIEKHILLCAGMAGGSSDGAAVLRALRQLYCPGLEDCTLEEMGALVGSDVPFCVRGGTALAEGRGEILTALPRMPECRLVICKPNFGISTPELFGRVQAEQLRHHPDTAAMRSALASGTLLEVAGNLCNVFEEILNEKERSSIAAIEKVMLKHGALNAVMTGSGPTVFGLFSPKGSAAEEAAGVLKARWPQVFLAEPL